MANAAQLETCNKLTAILSPGVGFTIHHEADDPAAYATYATPGMNRTRVCVTSSGAIFTIEDLFNPGAKWVEISDHDDRWDAIHAADIAVAK